MYQSVYWYIKSEMTIVHLTKVKNTGGQNSFGQDESVRNLKTLDMLKGPANGNVPAL